MVIFSHSTVENIMIICLLIECFSMFVYVVWAIFKTRFKIFEDGIIIRDFILPAIIPSHTIESIELSERCYCGVWFGFGGRAMWIKKGFKKEDGKYIVCLFRHWDEHPKIIIYTANRVFCINRFRKKKTVELYEKMISTVKLNDKGTAAYGEVCSPLWRCVLLEAFVLIPVIVLLICSIVTMNN